MLKKNESLTIGRNVIRRELKGLEALVASLDATFVKAVEAILENQGHLIVVGLGKSGHIGRKIADDYDGFSSTRHFKQRRKRRS